MFIAPFHNKNYWLVSPNIAFILTSAGLVRGIDRGFVSSCDNAVLFITGAYIPLKKKKEDK